MNFFDLDKSGKREVFERAALQTGRTPAVIEKDLWVCWTLEQFFVDKREHSLVFKGGTSLSKVYRVIDRFSEDVDLTINKFDLGYSLDEHEESKTKIRKALNQVRENLCKLIKTEYVPLLSVSAEAKVALDPDERTTLLLHYESVTIQGPSPYMNPVVRIEFGARNPIEPSEKHIVECDAAPHVPQITFPSSKVDVLSGSRTFWEKATLLHMLWHRPIEKVREGTAERQARHYYDLVCLSKHQQGQAALTSERHLLEKVSKDKETLFPASWAKYQDARRGALRLVPGDDLQQYLKADYTKMISSGMFGTQPPTWEIILEELQDLENRINSSGKTRADF